MEHERIRRQREQRGCDHGGQRFDRRSFRVAARDDALTVGVAREND